jgi:hypothetical protein
VGVGVGVTDPHAIITLPLMSTVTDGLAPLEQTTSGIVTLNAYAIDAIPVKASAKIVFEIFIFFLL